VSGCTAKEIRRDVIKMNDVANYINMAAAPLQEPEGKHFYSIRQCIESMSKGGISQGASSTIRDYRHTTTTTRSKTFKNNI
jgi:hypothetical protein